MTFDEFMARAGAFLAIRWLEEIGWNRDTIVGFLEHGIPVDYAKVIASTMIDKETGVSAIPVSLWPKLLHPPKSLTKKLTPVNVNSAVTEEHRMNIAKGQKPGDKFMAAITAKGFSQGRLAAALGVKPALLSMYRNGKRPIPQDRADKVQELTGWKATGRNWPGGIVS